MCLSRISFSQIAPAGCTLALGVAAGMVITDRVGLFPGGTNPPSAWLADFPKIFWITLLPQIVLILLSVTVYATPAALAALFLESTQDTCYILYALRLFGAESFAAAAPCVFFIGTRAFFTYGYLLLALRTLCYRARARSMPSDLSYVLGGVSRRYFRDYTAIAGLVCLFAFFAHTVFYFT